MHSFSSIVRRAKYLVFKAKVICTLPRTTLAEPHGSISRPKRITSRLGMLGYVEYFGRPRTVSRHDRR